MLTEGEGHREREGVGVGGVSPLFIVDERDAPFHVAEETAHLTTVKDGDQFPDLHLRLFRAASTIESRMTGCAKLVPFVGLATVRTMPSASGVRSTRPISSRGLPCSTSTIHCRLTPTFSARVFWSRRRAFLRSRIRAPRSIGVRIRIYHLCSQCQRTLTLYQCQRTATRGKVGEWRHFAMSANGDMCLAPLGRSPSLGRFLIRRRSSYRR